MVALLAVWSLASAFAERQPFERYQSIIDRQMFGPLPPGFDPEKLPSEVARGAGGAEGEELTKEQEQVKSSVHFSVINVTPDGKTAVGFTDNSDAKAPRHYYLKVGESRDGWEVKAADPVSASMTIVKNGIEVSLTLGGDSAKGAGKTERAADTAAAAPRANGGLLSGGTRFGGSLASRRMLREQRQQKRHDEELAAERAKREADAEAIRAEMREELNGLREMTRKVREEHEKKEREEKERQEKERQESEPAAEE